MRAIKNAKNYIQWLFFPSKFIFPNDKAIKIVSIPGWETLELVSDQERLKEVNAATQKKYLGGKGNEFLSGLFGKASVFNLDGDMHRIARKLISSELNREKIRLNIPYIENNIETELEKLKGIKKVNLGLLSRRITMKSVLLPLIGNYSEEVFERLLKEFENCTGFIANFVSYNKRFWPNDNPSRLSIGNIAVNRVKKLDESIYSLINDRKKNPNANSVCVLDKLIEAQTTHSYDDKFIRDNIVSTIAAGYDTSGAALTWMLYWLSKQGQYEALSKKAKSDDSQNYLDSFIFESLRYCAPLEILPRKIVTEHENCQLEAEGVTMVCPCPHLVHHDAKIYDNPKEFKADRFVNKKFRATEFFPYGAASRMCLGSGLAHTIMTCTLQKLLDRNEFFHFKKDRFSPVRRNVSIWPGFFTTSKLIKTRGD